MKYLYMLLGVLIIVQIGCQEKPNNITSKAKAHQKKRTKKLKPKMKEEFI